MHIKFYKRSKFLHFKQQNKSVKEFSYASIQCRPVMSGHLQPPCNVPVSKLNSHQNTEIQIALTVVSIWKSRNWLVEWILTSDKI